MKMLLSGLLSLVMVFSLTPSTIVFADNEDNTSPTTQSEEGTIQEMSGSSEKPQKIEGGEETTAQTEEKDESSNSVDLNTMSSDELFEYIMNVSSDDMDALYEEYSNLNDLISKLSEDQQSQLAKKFGNSEEDVNLVDNNTANEAQPASDTNNNNDGDSTVTSGTCGENLTWTLDSDGTLTISGEGEMYNYFDYVNPSPWLDYNVTNIKINEGVASIGDNAFSNDNSKFNITSVLIPSTVNSIGSYAFYKNKKITTIALPENLKTIGNGAFNNCTSLESITIPSGVETIGEGAFSGCTSLQSITIPSSVTTVGNFPFYGCSSVTNIYFYGTQGQWDGIKEKVLGYMATTQSPTVHLIVASGKCGDNLTWTLESDGKLTISGTGKMYDYSVAEMAPWYGKEVTSVEIEEGVTTIGNYAFIWGKLTSVTIASSVETIGVSAFLGNSYLTELNIKDGLTTIGASAFYVCGSLKSITIPDTVTTIGGCAFYYCTNLESISLPCRFKNAIDSTWFAGAKATNPTVRDHELTKIDKKAATCTEDGHEEYWQCKKCQRMFTDENETDEITKPEVIEASHKYGKVIYTWSDDHKQCTATRECETCHDTDTETQGSTSEVVRNQSCTDTELTKYSVKFKNDAFKTQTTEAETADAKGHSYGKVTYTWSSDHKKCTATRECETCHDKDTETKNSTSEVTRNKSCTETESTKYSVTFENKAFDAQTTEVETADSKGHALTKVDEIKATCEKAGQEAYWECSDCHKKFSDKDGNDEIESPVVIKALGHKLTEVKKVDATCTESGSEAYWKCDTCKSLFSDSEGKNKIDAIATIPASGHSLTKVSKQDSTASKEGNITYWHCDECEKYYSDEDAEKEIKKADTVISKVTPVIIKGDGVTVTVGEKKELSFTSDASYDDFIRAEVDGKILDSDNYTVKSGSTIVTLKSEYVASLEEGEHTLSIVSQSGTATAHFTVSKKKADTETKKSETTNTTKKSDSQNDSKQSTNTGVQSNVGLYISLIMISMIGIVVLGRRRSEQ